MSPRFPVLILAVALLAALASASPHRARRDKSSSPHHHHHQQDVGRRPQQQQQQVTAGYWYGRPHARPVRFSSHHQQQQPTLVYRQQQQQPGAYRQQRPVDGNYQLPHAPIGAAQPYANAQARPQSIPAPLPIPLTPSGVVLPSPPTRQYKPPAQSAYLAGSASTQAAYLGPFRQPQSVQPPPLYARQPQQAGAVGQAVSLPGPAVPGVQPPPLYSRGPQQQIQGDFLVQPAVAPIQPPPLAVRGPEAGVHHSNDLQVQHSVSAIQPPPLIARDPQQSSQAPIQSAHHSNDLQVQHSVSAIQPPPLIARDPQQSIQGPTQFAGVQAVAPIQPPPLIARDPQQGSLGSTGFEAVAPIQPPPLIARDPQTGSLQSVGNDLVSPLQPPPLIARDPQLSGPASALSPVSNDVAPLQPPPLYARGQQSGSGSAGSSVAPIQPPPLIARDPQSQQDLHSGNVSPIQPPPLFAREPSADLSTVNSFQNNDISLAETSHSIPSFPAVQSVEPLLPPPLYVREQGQQQHDLGLEGSSAVQQQPFAAEDQPGSYAPSPPVTVPPVPALTSNDEPVSDFAVPIPPLPAPIGGNALSDAPASVSGGDGGDSQWTQGSIPWTLEKLGFNTLNDLLVLSGQDEVMDKEGPFTVFVPVDQAFEILIQKLGGMEKATEQFNENPEVLTSLLKHHLIPGRILSSSLQDNMVAQSALGTPLRVKFYESEDSEWRPLKVITVNGARLVKPDIQATNGVIHIVDRVLFPVPQADIYSTLKGDPQQRFTTLVSAIERAGLTSALANPTGGPYTVFAPTDKAFSLISRSELNGMLNDPARLTKLLQRHVVQDLIYTSGLQGFQKAYTLDFELIYIYHAKGMTKVNGANVVDQDLTTLNGVIHTIDSVLGIN